MCKTEQVDLVFHVVRHLDSSAITIAAVAAVPGGQPFSVEVEDCSSWSELSALLRCFTQDTLSEWEQGSLPVFGCDTTQEPRVSPEQVLLW